MAYDHSTLTSGTLAPRGQSSEILAPDRVAGRIVNMELTREGTLRSVRGPCEYHPATWENNGQSGPAATTYSTPHNGLYHCRTQGGVRDILLAHYGGAIWVHSPWEADWVELLSPNSSALEETPFPEEDPRPTFLTQFESTPNGVVIVPQGGRAHFYDGERIAPLGFSEVPGAPTPLGPRPKVAYDSVAREDYDVANANGYAHSGRRFNKDGRPPGTVAGTYDALEEALWETGAPPAIGTYRLGSIDNSAPSAVDGPEKLSNPMGGVLMAGQWRAAVQYVDYWGNLSPVGSLSAPVMLQREDNLVKERRKDAPEDAERLKVQVAWGDIPLGPDHCIARNLLRTKDQLNTDLPGLFWVPPNATTSRDTFATLEDRAVTLYPDNIPDSWLQKRAQEVVPMPTFRLCKMAYGRMWFANMLGNPGLVRASYPGMWGTVDPEVEIYPDATGAEVTGMHFARSGLLIFTETSTFLITPNDQGDGFVAVTLSPTAGCVSPDSIETTNNGLTIWLGRDGFYAYDGNSVSLISQEIKEDVIERINPAWRLRASAAVDVKMGEYRCSVPVDGSTENNLVVVYDAQGWRERNDGKYQALCTTKDDRGYMLGLGTVSVDGGSDHDSVWILDREALGTVSVDAREVLVETSWLRSTLSRRRGSPTQLEIWLRESENGTLTVETMKDWREHPLIPGTGNDPKLYAEDDPPPFWDTASYDASYVNTTTGVRTKIPVHFTRRRPYWTNVALSVPSCEVFKVRFRYTGDVEFVGFGYELYDKHAGGAKMPEGT